MKKVIIKLICFAVLAAVALSLVGCLDNDSPTYYDENGIGYRSKCVIVIPFDASGESAEITIIDEYKMGDKTIEVLYTIYDNRGITELIPQCENAKVSNNPEVFTDKTMIEEKTFDLYFHIGKNLMDMGIQDKVFYKETEGGYIKYNINKIWDVSPENKYFYSENGKLYYKGNSRYKQGQLVPGS